VVTIPAAVWRGGPVLRALTVGGTAGLSLGGLAWLDSGFFVSGVIVMIVVGTFYGVWMGRRMARYWPSASNLSGAERVTVARAVRRGEPIDNARLNAPLREYGRGLRAAAETEPWLRWMLALALAVSAVAAAWDAFAGSWGNIVASAIYLTALLIEVFWYPGWRAHLLANADIASASARKSF